MKGKRVPETILGIDLGPNSIGWALLDGNGNDDNALKATGVRVFDAGVDSLETDGKGKSRNQDRRDARLIRRGLERRSRRMRNLARLLQRSGLLPPGDVDTPQGRDQFLQELDRTLENPYRLRARALDEQLTPYKLGRALYHLAQRRGFLSNRQSAPKKDEEEGAVKGGISELQAKIDAVHARTLGEYFAGIDPHKDRIRQRYTSRAMYEREFDAVWTTQRRHHPALLTDDLRKQIRRGIFHQRPLKSQNKFIGMCTLEPDRPRAPWAELNAQRFRYLQRVNDLLIIDQATGEEAKLTEDQRRILIEYLETKEDVTFGGVRRLLKLRNVEFNLERGGEKKIPGNRTTARLSKIFGPDRWIAFTDDEKNAVINDWRRTVKDETIRKRGLNFYRLDEESAERFSNLRLDSGYCNFSRHALRKLLFELQKGTPLQTAIKEKYPEQFSVASAAMDALPPVERKSGLPSLRNPIVMRSLTELRHLVNSIIARYGRPDLIRIELARELRQTPKQRNETWKKMRDNETQRARAAEECRDKYEIPNPTDRDILKFLLWEECNKTCPYTGKTISHEALFGPNPEFDIEHIIPFERCLDNSYLNKTLCWVDENRRIKGNRTPFETYHGSDKWDDILNRVRNFRGRLKYQKLNRFKMLPEQVQTLLDDFTTRQLNDTRWASKWAKRYLGLLYGGIDDKGVDDSGRLRVQAAQGHATAFLRTCWGLNTILGDGPDKSRDDHRHHAVDAVAIAMTVPGTIKTLSDAAARASTVGRRLFTQFDPPWDGFRDHVDTAIKGITTSHRVSNRVRGKLHKETFYGRPRKDAKGNEYVHTRVRIEDLSPADVDNIVDPMVRRFVADKLAELDGVPKDAFKDTVNHPALETPNGRRVPIHRVRIRMNLSTFAVGSGLNARYVQSKDNHHMELFAILDDDGKVKKWDAEVVSMLEAYRRLAADKPIINRDHGPNTKFLFSLANRDVVELDTDGSRRLFVIRTITKMKHSKVVVFVPINSARSKTDIKQNEGFSGLNATPKSLRERSCRKLRITPLGEVRNAAD
ncbi:MAG: type II CRISPR RNA-guided endonuclease Cas9 [candidate division Zixibacteria bacterium]|nr:type II CRISPR RNA-guided endonuclease Cas9 [candidate division Zixibacteria bacterium]